MQSAVKVSISKRNKFWFKSLLNCENHKSWSIAYSEFMRFSGHNYVHCMRAGVRDIAYKYRVDTFKKNAIVRCTDRERERESFRQCYHIAYTGADDVKNAAADNYVLFMLTHSWEGGKIKRRLHFTFQVRAETCRMTGRVERCTEGQKKQKCFKRPRNHRCKIEIVDKSWFKSNHIMDTRK